MNILFFHSNGIVPTAGGISRTTHNLVRLFREKGHDVWLMGAKDKHSDASYDEHQRFLPSSERADLATNMSFMLDFIQSWHIDIIINQTPFSPDIVHLLSCCRTKTGTKVVSCYHNSILTPIFNYAYQKEYNLRKHRLPFLFWLLKLKMVNSFLVNVYITKYRKTFRATADSSDAVVLLCNGQVDEWQRMCGYADNTKVMVIPNYAPIANDSLYEGKKKMVLWGGTFDYAIKRPDLMLRIWAKVEERYPDWKLYMLGDGPALSEMKLLAQQLGLRRVVFTGRVTPTPFYKEAQIQCVTSVHESFSLVSVESMQYGNPVIAFNSYTAAPYVINDKENGLLIAPFDIDAYADSLKMLMDDNHFRESMGKSAQKSISRFTPDTVYALWQQLFERL